MLPGDDELVGEGKSDVGEIRGPHANAPVGVGPCQRHPSFEYPQPRHVLVRVAPRGEVARELYRRQEGVEELGAERDDDVGAVEVHLRYDSLSEASIPGIGDGLGSGGERLPGHVLRPWESGQEGCDQGVHSRPVHRACEETHLGAALGLLQQGNHVLIDCVCRDGERGLLSTVHTRRAACAVSVIQIENGGLASRAERAPIQRVIGIAFDLDDASFASLGEDAAARGASEAGSRVVEGLAGASLFGAHRSGQDLLCGLGAARCARESCGSSGDGTHAKKVAPIHGNGGAIGELDLHLGRGTVVAVSSELNQIRVSGSHQFLTGGRSRSRSGP